VLQHGACLGIGTELSNGALNEPTWVQCEVPELLLWRLPSVATHIMMIRKKMVETMTVAMRASSHVDYKRLLCMATADESIYDELTQTYTDTAVAGEAVGSASQKAIDELCPYGVWALALISGSYVLGLSAASEPMELGRRRTFVNFLVVFLFAAPPAAALRPGNGQPCADSAVKGLSEADAAKRFFMLAELVDVSGVTCLDRLRNLQASTDSQGFMPDGAWTSCLKKAVDYEVWNKDWIRQARFHRSSKPGEEIQGPAGQVITLFSERAAEAQLHLEDCLHEKEELTRRREAVAAAALAQQRALSLASLLQVLRGESVYRWYGMAVAVPNHRIPDLKCLANLVLSPALAEKIGPLRAYAHDTQHEKIIRACARGSALALAMMMFRKEEEAEPLIQCGEMLLDKDAILRYGGCFAIALAYVGTSQNAAIRKLLHISVSDVSDDVRRAAVMALGFVMCNVPEQLPGVVKLLAESYNPHVRYAAAMALGIACAGTALLEAHNLLQPLMSAMGLLYMQTSPGKTERIKELRVFIEEFREKLQKVIGDKHEVMTRFGAILAHGIMDVPAGGRNSCASLFSKSYAAARQSDSASSLRCGTGPDLGLSNLRALGKSASRGAGAEWLDNGSILEFWTIVALRLFSKLMTYGRSSAPGAPNLHKGIELSKAPWAFAAMRYPEPMQPPKKEETAKVLSTAAKAKQLKEKKEKEANELKKAPSNADVDMDDKASIGGSVAEGAASSVRGADIVAGPLTQGTTVVGSAATESVAAQSDLGSEMMEVDDPQAPPAGEKPAPKEAKADEAKGEAKSEAADKKDEKKARMPVESGGCTAPAVIASDDDDDDDVDHGDGEDDDDGLMMLMMMMMMIVMMMMMMMMMMLMLMVVMMVVVVMMMLMKMTPVRMAMMMMKKKKMRTRMKIVMVTMILPTVNTILIINILSDGRAN
ncbi:RPN2B, partial [Symbiodinium sp. KB8]